MLVVEGVDGWSGGLVEGWRKLVDGGGLGLVKIGRSKGAMMK